MTNYAAPIAKPLHAGPSIEKSAGIVVVVVMTVTVTVTMNMKNEKDNSINKGMNELVRMA